MTIERVAALFVALVVAAAPSLASAQHERFTTDDVHVAPPARDLHLRGDDDVLTAPSTGEYVVSIGVMALGGAGLAGGVIVGLMGSFVAHPVEGTSNPGLADGMFVGGIAGAAVGAILLAVGIGNLVGLHHRAGQARREGLAGVTVSPTIDGGISLGAWGTF